MFNLPPGRMGNKLLHYNFLRKIATKADVDYFHPAITDLDFCENMGNRDRVFLRRKVNRLLEREIEINPLDVFNSTPTNLLNFIKIKSQNGYDILLEGSYILEPFFDYMFYDPNDFIKIKKELAVSYAIPCEDNKVNIGIHFRGTDYYSFDKNAVLDFDYYQKSILFCLEYFSGSRIEFLLASDDLENPICKKILSFLASLNSVLLFGNDKIVFPCVDLYRLSQCDVIISSPSTFAIVAGYFGKKLFILQGGLIMRLMLISYGIFFGEI